MNFCFHFRFEIDFNSRLYAPRKPRAIRKKMNIDQWKQFFSFYSFVTFSILQFFCTRHLVIDQSRVLWLARFLMKVLSFQRRKHQTILQLSQDSHSIWSYRLTSSLASHCMKLILPSLLLRFVLTILPLQVVGLWITLPTPCIVQSPLSFRSYDQAARKMFFFLFLMTTHRLAELVNAISRVSRRANSCFYV